MNKRIITRREFLRLSALTTVGAVAVACGGQAPAVEPQAEATAAPEPTMAPEPEATMAPEATEAPAAPEPTMAPEAEAAPASKYKEAPMLAALVAAGSLPPVDERLPVNPLVMEGLEGIGNYGGTWRRAFSGVSDSWGPTKIVDRAWGWFDQSLTLKPRLLESWSVSPDGKEWTIKMREGVKWSDGLADHTTDDLAFWYDHELLNTKLTAAPGTPWRDPDGTVVQFEAVDPLTAKFTYGQPKPMFIYNMTRGGTGGGATIPPLPVSPSHYMKEYHEDTTSDPAKLAADVTAAGFPDWQSYYMQFARQWTANPDRPTLGPWRALGALSTELFEMERNPYFFAVDADGQQLPYIDRITHRLFENQEVKNLWVTNGEIDFQGRHMTVGDIALYKSAEAAGDYLTVLGINASHPGLQLNQSTKNELLNEFFNQRDARIAISLGINRDQINELVYNGLLKPRQYSPLPMSPQFYPKQAEAYLEYDPDTANKLLDDLGYVRGADGIRLHKDGTTPISFIIEGHFQSGTPEEDQALLIAQDLEKIGLKMTYKYVERALYTEHYTANDIEGGCWGGDRTVLPLVPEAIIFRGVQPDRPWAPGWGFWYDDPTNPVAVEPPADHWIRTIWQIWDEEIAVEPDPDKQTAAFFKILDIWAEELPMIGILGEQPQPVIVKNGFMGYQPGLPLDDTTGDEHFPQSETYYWDDPDAHSG